MYARKTKRSGQIQRSKAGRVCKKQGCKQRLSIYNLKDYCHVHQREFLD